MHRVRILCRCLQVSASGYYAWCRRPESRHHREDRRLKVLVRTSFEASKQRYGSPRIHEDLREQHARVSRKRVIRLMQEDGLQARPRKRFTCTTMSDHGQPVAANLLDRQFTAAAPNRRWVGDATEFVIGESGKLYLAAILDLFSRFVVGWALSAANDRHLALKALDMALKRRGPELGLLHHSDQGGPYVSEDYQRRLDACGITCSMSRRGNCYDNAVMEAFFSSVKSEVADRFDSAGEAEIALFDTSRCSITSGGAIRHSARSVRPRLNTRPPHTAWTLPSLWTPRTRPQGLGKPRRTRFPTAPTPITMFAEKKTETEHADSVNPSTKSDHPHVVAADRSASCRSIHASSAATGTRTLPPIRTDGISPLAISM